MGRSYRIKEFMNYTIIWISQNLAIPFWTIGHVHLMINSYKDLYEIFASLGMNIIVAAGFLLDWHKNKSKHEKN